MGKLGDKIRDFAVKAKAGREEFLDAYDAIGDAVIGIFPGLVGMEEDYVKEWEKTEKKSKKVRKKG